MSGRRLGERGLANLRRELSDRDLAIIGYVGQLRLMSAGQIEALSFPGEAHASALSARRIARRADYQFQVSLTWSRTQYCLTLNAGLISVAAALLGLKGRDDSALVVAVFCVGIAVSLFSILALVIGRNYYEPVLTRMRALEEALELEKRYRIRTTTRQGGPSRTVKISHLLIGLFIASGVSTLAA
jgi:hypothetical protein